MIESKTQILSRICIKPFIPTPLHLGTHRVSLLDQLSPHLHNIMTIFYQNDDPSSIDDAKSMDLFFTRSKLLQKSLSETLSRFYPFAGRFEDDATILCNDEGAVFIEAKTDMSLSNFLTHPDLETIGSQFLLATDELKTTNQLQRPLLVIGFTLFSCGGNVLSIGITHKISDLASVMTLVQSWTGGCRGTKPIVVPDLNIAASLMPPREILDISESVVLSTKNIASRRFVFRASKISELKAKVLTAYGKELKHHPSRVEVAMALIWKCAMAAFNCKMGKFKPTVLIQAANLRTRMDPPLPENSMGNLAWLFPLTVESESEMEVPNLVKKMIDMKVSLNKKVHKFNREENIVETMKEGLREREQLLRNEKDLAVYLCASWCKFPMLETDFGWGKPVWVTGIDKRNLMGNTIHLVDTRVAGEVEALVHLEEQEMNMFEHNEELLQYALLNPPIV